MSKAPTGRFRTVSFDAVVLADGPQRFIDQTTLAAWLDGPTSETIRNWVKKGMPREGTDKRPRYPVPDCVIWHAYYRYRQITAKGERVGILTMQEARDWHVARQAKEDPDGFVLVPTDHDHPLRATQLARAAAGRPPGADDT